MPEVCELDEEFEGTKCKIDNKIVLLWLFPVAGTLFVAWLAFLLLLNMGASASLSLTGSTINLLVAFIVFTVLVLALGFSWFTIRHRAVSYTITRTEVIINEGALNKKRTVIPFVQVQDIHVKRPLLYRVFGISLIEFETASGTKGGELHGVANANETVKILLERVKELRKSPEQAPTEDRELLSGILEELRSLREKVERGPSHQNAEEKKDLEEIEKKAELLSSKAPGEEKELKEIRRETERIEGKYPEASRLKDEIDRILHEKEGDEEEGKDKKGKVCFPVEHAEPDRLEDGPDSGWKKKKGK